MKHLIIAFFVLGQSIAFAQQKGATPSAGTQPSSSAGQTYAVVVGISDYQDKDIPDLRFADKDAEAFANFLRSPAGGSLDGDHLKLLTNREATMGQFAAALDWLWEVSKEGDLAIIYFSGHGDVEKKSITQPGYLLCWDAPSRVYMGGGAFALPMFQDVVTTLSAQNKAKVVVITDACRSGKLAGSSVGGTQVTGSNLARQYANEIKILSCQPEEYSIEGEQWGGGRGAFSYNLVNALYGMADGNNDLSVTLQEVGRYLEDHVTAEVAPVSQVPMVLGNRTERLSTVDIKLMAALRSGKTSQMVMLSPIESRGIEEDVLASVDTTTRELYHLFKKALKDKVFLEPSDACADAYFLRLIEEPKMQRLHSTMTRNYAAALIDDGQQFINHLLKNDTKAFDKFFSNGNNFFGKIAELTNRATQLLGEKHYIYKNLKAKEYYFRYLKDCRTSAGTDDPIAIANIRNNFLYIALSYEPEAPYLVYSMARSAPLDSTDFYINKLAQIAPSWALWYTSMGLKIHYSEPVRAIALYEKSIDLDSSFYPALFHLKSALEINGEREKANRCREQLIRLLYKQIEKDSDQLDNNAVAYLATALVEMRRYRDASRVLNIGLKSNAGEFNYFGYVSLLKILFCTSQYEIVVDTLLHLEKQIGHQPFAVSLGIAYTHLGDYEKAKKALLSVTDQTEMPIRDLPLLNVYRKTGCFKEALDYFNSLQILGSLDYFDRSEFELMSGDTASANKSLDTFLLKHTIHYKRNQSGPNGYENRIMALYRLGRMEEMQKTIQEADQNLDGDPWHHFRMACAYAQIGEPTKAFQQLSLAEQFGWLPSDFYYVYGNFYDPYLDPLRLLPEFKVIAKNWTPPYQDTSKN